VVALFFRDTNLTDVLFRLDSWVVDRAAHDDEPELNGAVAARLGEWRLQATRRVESLYRADRARLWMTPAVGESIAAAVARPAAARQAFVAAMNERFDFAHLRPIDAADYDPTADREADFAAYVDRSVLPLMLRDAREAGIRLYFVRVQRRPVGGRPPYQSPALRAYVLALGEYIRANGGLWHDDTGDPAQTLELYGDGDHLAREARERYTGMFWNRLGPHVH
jgi:hypothetical protein